LFICEINFQTERVNEKMEPVAIAAIASVCAVAGFLIWALTRKTAKPVMNPMIKSPSHEALNTMIAQLDDPTPVAASA
jgi:hypothetical protein